MAVLFFTMTNLYGQNGTSWENAITITTKGNHNIVEIEKAYYNISLTHLPTFADRQQVFLGYASKPTGNDWTVSGNEEENKGRVGNKQYLPVSVMGPGNITNNSITVGGVPVVPHLYLRYIDDPMVAVNGTPKKRLSQYPQVADVYQIEESGTVTLEVNEWYTSSSTAASGLYRGSSVSGSSLAWRKKIYTIPDERLYTLVLYSHRDDLGQIFTLKQVREVPKYTITVNANPANGGTVSGGGIFDEWTEITLTAVANPGYYFVDWRENDNIISSQKSITFEVTKSRTLRAEFLPISPTKHTITVSSNNTNWGTVSGGGNMDEGTQATVTATPKTGYRFVNWKEGTAVVSTSASYTFTVNGARNLVAEFEAESVSVTGVTINRTTLHLVEGESETLKVIISPENASNRNVTWKSDKPDIAVVDANGKVSAKAAGTATITVTTEEGNKTATCTVTVEALSVIPVFVGLEGEYNVGAASIPFKMKGADAAVFTVFKVNGEVKPAFSTAEKGTFLIEASSADGKTVVSTYVKVK